MKERGGKEKMEQLRGNELSARSTGHHRLPPPTKESRYCKINTLLTPATGNLQAGRINGNVTRFSPGEILGDLKVKKKNTSRGI